MAFVRALVAWLFMAVYWTGAIPVLAMGRALPPLHPFWHRYAHHVVRLWGRVTLFILGIRLEAINESTIENIAPRVMVANHQSSLDVIWGAAICPPAPLAIGKREVIWIPILNAIWWVYGFILINRKDHAEALRALADVPALALRESRTIILAPEGTRSVDGKLQAFKKGAFRMAFDAKLPIYPVVASGAHALMPKGAMTARRGILRVAYLPAVDVSKWTLETLDAHIESVRQSMKDAIDRLEKPLEHTQ